MCPERLCRDDGCRLAGKGEGSHVVAGLEDPRLSSNRALDDADSDLVAHANELVAYVDLGSAAVDAEPLACHLLEGLEVDLDLHGRGVELDVDAFLILADAEDSAVMHRASVLRPLQVSEE